MQVRAESAAAPNTVAAERRPPSNGWRVVAAKEFRDHVRSVRFVILIALLSLAAAGAVYAVSGEIRDVAGAAQGTPFLFLKLFTVAPEGIPSFITLVGLLAPLLGIAFGFDAVNSETSQGTLPRLVAQPIYRDDVINGKFVGGLAVIATALTALVLLVMGVGLFRLALVPSATEIVRLLVWLIVTVVYVGFWLGFSILCSVWLRRAATSALVSIALWLVLTLFGGLIFGLVADLISPVGSEASPFELIDNARVEQAVAHISPAVLYDDSTQALLDPEVRALGFLLPQQVDRAIPSELPLDQSLLLVWPQTVAMVGMTLVAFAGAYVLFMRREIRA